MSIAPSATSAVEREDGRMFAKQQMIGRRRVGALPVGQLDVDGRLEELFLEGPGFGVIDGAQVVEGHVTVLHVAQKTRFLCCQSSRR